MRRAIHPNCIAQCTLATDPYSATAQQRQQQSRAHHEVVALLWHLSGAAQSIQQEQEDARCSGSTAIPAYSYGYRSAHRKSKAPEAASFGDAALMMMSWPKPGLWDMTENGHNACQQGAFCNRGLLHGTYLRQKDAIPKLGEELPRARCVVSVYKYLML